MATATAAISSPVSSPTTRYSAAAVVNIRARSPGSSAAAIARTAELATLLRSTRRYPESEATSP